MSQRDINLFFGAFVEFDPTRGECFTSTKDGECQFFADPDELWKFLMEQRDRAGAVVKTARAPLLDQCIPRGAALEEAVSEYENAGGAITRGIAARRQGSLEAGSIRLTLDDIDLEEELDFD